MIMSKEDKNKIKVQGRFLTERGYDVSESDFSVTFDNGEIRFKAYYERYENQSGLDVRFLPNHHFIIGWIAYVRESYKPGEMERLEKVLYLLDYVKNNYEKITDIDYCLESRKLIQEHFEKTKQA